MLKTVAIGVNRLSDIARALNLSKSTTHRLLNTLERTGFVMQDDIMRKYYLGPLFLTLSSAPLVTHSNLVECAIGDIKKLHESSGETVALYIRIGTQRICLEELASPKPIKFMAGKGYIAPVYAGAPGRILLSRLKDDQLDRLLEHVEFIQITPNTITDKEVLRQELEKVRKDGYAISFGERVIGSASISAPVKNYSVPVALCIVGPHDRISTNLKSLLQEIKVTAARISNRLKEGVTAADRKNVKRD
ncbi:MAG: IclR family transcriptional regulator [Deltaproteobacteria bacterium]|nr:IclR family transcriptional regulator [Deltaproteobacteria bacterium]